MLKKIEWFERGFIAIFVGILSLDDVYSVTAKISGDPRSETLRFGLFDVTGIESSTLTERDAYIAGAHDIGLAKTLPNPIKYAIAVTNPEAIAFNKAYKKLMDANGSQLDIQLFSDVETAKRWLGHES